MDANMGKLVDEQSFQRSCFLDSGTTNQINLTECKNALFMYESMHKNVPVLEGHNYVDILKACALLIDVKIGCQVHADLARMGLLETNFYVKNSLISMYVKWGCLSRAIEVHQALSVRDVVTWTALINGHAQLGSGGEALNCFRRMQLECICPNGATFACILKACGATGAIDKGREVHLIVLVNGLLDQDVVVGNALLYMYSRCGMLMQAQRVFEGLSIQNIVSWNSLMSSYTQHECNEEAFFCFQQMQMEGICPTPVTFLCALNACGCTRDKRKGAYIYAAIVGQSMLEKDLALSNALVDMLVKCGDIERAQEVFNLLPGRDVVTWTALIGGYAQHKRSEESLYLFEQMRMQGIAPNIVTYTCSLKACSSIGDFDKACEIHCEAARNGILAQDATIGNALVDMYMKSGMLTKAQEVFDELSQLQNVVSWNSLIAGYVLHEYNVEALNLYTQMHHDGIPPNAVTVVLILSACGNLYAADAGKVIHDEILSKDFLRVEPMIGSALVNMYVKCGMYMKAKAVFNELSFCDSVAWNSLITGYAQLGDVKSVFHTINHMITEGNSPDAITLINVLNACSHAGMITEGGMYFIAISTECSVIPSIDHYICILDLISRAGQLEKSIGIMRHMPFHPNNVMTAIVLGGCRKWGNVELATEVFEEALQVDEVETAACLCMYNIITEVDSL
ncbi:hypothetical protein KP509_20G015100 [Ceratopteris richardii]|nr:hypothetical protein KP509_20G015100 [Ceratopteris richardii]